MKKTMLLAGFGIGFVVGSRAGRGPYESLESAVRNLVKQPKVQASLQSVADNVAEVRDTTLDAATDAVNHASKAASGTIDHAAKKATDETDKLASKVSNGS